MFSPNIHIFYGTSQLTTAQPPYTPSDAINHEFNHFYRPDDPDWHWLEDASNSEVRDFLSASNAHHAAWFSPLQPLAESLYQGHLARRELGVTGLETPLDHFTVWTVTDEDQDYPCWWRYPNGQPEQRQCFFNLPARAAQHEFFDIGDMAMPADEQWLAWTEDTQGDERYSLWLKQLPNGSAQCLLNDIGPGLCWAEDQTNSGATLLFTRFDATQRPDSIWRLPLGVNQGKFTALNESLIFREDDPEFWVGVGKTRSRQWLLIESASKDTSEILLLCAHQPDSPLHCLHPRQPGIEASIEHRPGFFYCLHNKQSAHFQLDVIRDTHIHQPDAWQTLIDACDNTTLEGVDAFSWGLVISERDHSLAQVYLRRLVLDSHHRATLDHRLSLPELPCSQWLEDTPHFDTSRLRLREESFTQLPRWVELDLTTQERRVIKTQPLHGDLQPEHLISQRLWATSHDGETVPVSIVMRADLAGQALPTVLYGYGAYGEPLDPWFSIARLELLSRGIAFAVAHVRGGGERGEPWYLDGKMANKENSFHDFLAARDALVSAGVSLADRLLACGASAGGLLVGACLNRAPHAFCGAVLDVPFVDVLRTMQNPALPLTTAEYSEWGNPADASVAQRIQGYSPLDNVAPRQYPAIWIEGSWFDTRVSYWEPAKYYAKLRQCQQGDAPILLHTDMSSGHGGASGRFKAWREAARQDAFILWALDCADDE